MFLRKGISYGARERGGGLEGEREREMGGHPPPQRHLSPILTSGQALNDSRLVHAETRNKHKQQEQQQEQQEHQR